MAKDAKWTKIVDMLIFVVTIDMIYLDTRISIDWVKLPTSTFLAGIVVNFFEPLNEPGLQFALVELSLGYDSRRVSSIKPGQDGWLSTSVVAPTVR